MRPASCVTEPCGQAGWQGIARVEGVEIDKASARQPKPCGTPQTKHVSTLVRMEGQLQAVQAVLLGMGVTLLTASLGNPQTNKVTYDRRRQTIQPM